MKLITTFILLFCFSNGFSQSNFEKMPENVKEIHFEYTSKSNFYYDEVGIYGDTLLFELELQNVKYIKLNHPKENYNCGFVPFSIMDSETKDKVASIFFHSNIIFKAVYNFKKNTTKIAAVSNEEDRKLFTNIFGKDYSRFKFKITLNYKKNIKTTFYPNIYYTYKFEEIKKIIKWSDSINGTFNDKWKNKLLTNFIKSDENLPKQITLGLLFENNNFGITKVTDFYTTKELKSVSYR
ncbi:hypothetical protein [Flavobacterium sp.]|jgi:hypothetical protein|uniref:hypothetical protein n=1 Tax=Flavobacterium sp. TaxID=239 RepID=UPI0037C1979C